MDNPKASNHTTVKLQQLKWKEGSFHFFDMSKFLITCSLLLYLTNSNVHGLTLDNTAEPMRFHGFKVIRISPTELEQVDLVKNLEEKHLGVSFWTEIRDKNDASLSSIDLMVPPHLIGDVSRQLSSSGAEVETIIDDVQRLINRENPMLSLAVLREKNELTWQAYHGLDTIYSWIDKLPEKHPNNVKVKTIGKSTEGRPLKMVILSSTKDGENSNKPVVWVDSGLHAREWITPAVGTYIINELLSSKSRSTRNLLSTYDWYFVPVSNPDGYVYSHTMNRMWRKTRSKTQNSKCMGVDPNRNWDFHFGDRGASPDPCSETYHGSKPFSEPETKAMSQVLTSLKNRLAFYLSLHSYSQMILLPYGVTAEKMTDEDFHQDVGNVAANAMAKKFGTKYQAGNVVELLYEASGGSQDWVKKELNPPLSITLELRDTGRTGFLLPANQIIPTAQEVLDGLLSVSEKLKTGKKSWFDKFLGFFKRPSKQIPNRCSCRHQ